MSKTKRERFEEVASRRVNGAITALQSLQKCSNIYNYEYSEADVNKIVNTLRKQIDQ